MRDCRVVGIKPSFARLESPRARLVTHRCFRIDGGIFVTARRRALLKRISEPRFVRESNHLVVFRSALILRTFATVDNLAARSSQLHRRAPRENTNKKSHALLYSERRSRRSCGRWYVRLDTLTNECSRNDYGYSKVIGINRGTEAGVAGG